MGIATEQEQVEICKCGCPAADHLWDINPWPESEPEWEVLACHECGETPTSKPWNPTYVCVQFEYSHTETEGESE